MEFDFEKTPFWLVPIPALVFVLILLLKDSNSVKARLLTKTDQIDTTLFEYRPGGGRGSMIVNDSLFLVFKNVVLIDTPTDNHDWVVSHLTKRNFDLYSLRLPFSLYKESGSDTIFAFRESNCYTFKLLEN